MENSHSIQRRNVSSGLGNQEPTARVDIDNKNIEAFILEKKRITAQKVIDLQKDFDVKMYQVRAEWMGKI